MNLQLNVTNPQWLWGVPALAILAAVLVWWCGYEIRRRMLLFAGQRVGAPAISRGVLLRKRLRIVLVCLSLMALCVALARPMGPIQSNTADRHGVNLLIALDGSRSMLAQDVSPDRFTLAQAGIQSLLNALNGDRAGLILFAGQPTVVSPLTFDSVSLELIAQGMSVELAGKGGSSLGAVIERAVDFFDRKDYGSKVLLVLTDGEETEGDAVVEAQQAYRNSGVRIFTVGVGTTAGSVIPNRVRNAQRNWVQQGTVRDQDGREVHSTLDEGLLRNVAHAGGGAYVDLQATGADLSAFFLQHIKPLAAPMDAVAMEDLTEWFHIPLIVAFSLLVLEMLLPHGVRHFRPSALPTPGARFDEQSRRARGRQAAAAGLALFVSLPVVHDAQATAAQTQALLNEGRFTQAFASLQRALLDEPDDPLTQYNYAIGAYGVQKYSVAVEWLEKLASGPDADIARRSQLALGNAYFRLGEQALKGDPAVSLMYWEQALSAYEKGTDLPQFAHNRAKVRTDMQELLQKLARQREAAGDEAARVIPDQGVTGWREALGYLDKALSLAPEADRPRTLIAARNRVAGKIYQAFFDLAQDKQRRAGFQRYTALKMAIEQMQEAVADYDEALTARPGDAQASAARKEALAEVEPWLIELASQQHEEAQGLRGGFLEEAIALWEQAEANYQKVLQNNPASAAALQGKQRNDRARHDGYVALGDRKQQQAAPAHVPTQEKDALLEGALGAYQTALGLQPDNADTAARLRKLGGQLASRFVERGGAELARGRTLAEPQPPEAIAWLERAVQSFSQGLRFDPEHAAGQQGKREAQALLRELRDADAQNQRRMLAQNKDLTDARDMDDPGELALKLLDYDTEKLASRKQQNYTAPSSVMKDW